ncbi:MAG: 1-deoxy-D-xylulose-5-phosphate reductoisomerase [Ignavibacteriae bacterium HGW-Ignavibacteriae-3]|nr:MAG: 1-deoxy-D-xylulose-5-phosphate reductoisomerase [Ignavibacteriae bacterium HGW-Ignavibacteriae-3]
MKKILILGSTGSIGVNTLEIVRAFPDKFEIIGLTANSNIHLLKKQMEEFHPKTIVIADKKKSEELKKTIGNSCEVLSGNEGLLEIAKRNNYDILVSALVGFVGLAPTIEAIKLKKRIALANKETLVTAGELVIDLCKKHKTELIPVDSEHSAIFQCLNGENPSEISKIILTASGGPFLNKSKEEFENVTVEDALNHPNWKMGSKITIDSASMMNKGLEVIEAHWLFGLPKDKIEVIIHPQSIIHSMVEFRDGSVKAQLSTPDMKLPIIYALSFPERFNFNAVATDLKKINQLTFFEPDFDKFTCLKMAYDVIETGGTSSCILNAANEVAVEKFLSGKIKFNRIPDLIEDALNAVSIIHSPDLETIFDCDFKTRDYLKHKFN